MEVANDRSHWLPIIGRIDIKNLLLKLDLLAVVKLYVRKKW
jgi:hypothetical protein